nr:hypothetical protein [Tanacetum cinerariifolium]
NIVLKGNSAKSMTTDKDGNLKIHPLVTIEEHQQNAIKERFGRNVESKKMQKSLLKQKFKEFKISEEEGLDKGYEKMQKILTQMNNLKIKPEPEDVNMKFLRGLPPSWYGIALILKTKGRLEYISFDDLYNKLKFLEIDTKGYSSSSSTLSNAALGSSKSKCSVVDDVIYSFFANHKIDQHLVYEDLDQMNKEEFKEYDQKHQMAMLSIKVHRFEKKHGRKIKFNGRENERFDKKLVKCFNCKKMGHFSRECRAQSGKNSSNYQKYKSKEAGKDESDSKAMVVVDGSIDWDKQTEAGNTKPRSLENFGMIAGIKIESDADSESEVVSANDAIPTGVYVSTGNVSADVVSPQSETEFAFMGLSTEMVYGKKANDSSKIKTNDDSISHSNDAILFDFSDRSSEPSTNDLQTCDSNVECLRPNHSDHDSIDSISSISAPTSESRDTIVIDCDRQEDFTSVCSIETDVKSSKTLLEKAKDRVIVDSDCSRRTTLRGAFSSVIVSSSWSDIFDREMRLGFSLEFMRKGLRSDL